MYLRILPYNLHTPFG